MPGPRPVLRRERIRLTTGLETTLRASFRFLNPSPHPGQVLYPMCTRIAEQRDLDPIIPLFVPNEVLRSIDAGSVNTRGMAPSIFFLDFGASYGGWREARSARDRRPHMRFSGGVIRLSCVSAILIDDRARFKRRAIQKIMEHEMDHARDWKTALRGEVARLVRDDEMVNEQLIERRPILESHWLQWFGSAQTGEYQRRSNSIMAAVQGVAPNARLLDADSQDPLAGRRQIDSWLGVRVWKPAAERLGAALHRQSGHLQTMNEIPDALDDPDDPELVQEHHGRLPPNVA